MRLSISSDERWVRRVFAGERAGGGSQKGGLAYGRIGIQPVVGSHITRTSEGGGTL